MDAAAAAVAERLGETTVLVNRPGINKIGPAELLTDEDWTAVLDVNLTGLYRCCRAFGGRMLAAARGCIVNVASIIGPQVGMPRPGAVQRKQDGDRRPDAGHQGRVDGSRRRVNALLPGPVRMPMVETAIAQGIVVEKEVVDRTPAGRWGTAEDVARTVVLFCGPDAAFVTGQTLVVDSGYTAYGAAHAATRIPGVANA